MPWKGNKYMVFSSTVFLFLFLPVVIAVYYNPIVKNRGFRNIVLLLSSLFFYGWGEPVFVFLMILSIIVNWAFGLMVDGMRKKGSVHGMKLGMILSVVYNLGLMFIFKYLTFVTKNISYLIHNDRGRVVAAAYSTSDWNFILYIPAYVICVRCIL